MTTSILIFIVVIAIVALVIKIIGKSDDSLQDWTLVLNTYPVPDKNENKDVKELLTRQYTPRTGAFNIEIFTHFKKSLRPGDQLEISFKKIEAYYQDVYFEVAFKHQGKIIAVEREYYNDPHPLVRMVRAHFSGYEIVASVKSIYENLLTVNIQLVKDGKEIKNKAQRKKSTKKRGKFDVVGYHYLPEDTKTMVWKVLKVGDQLKLLADPTNSYDKKAIKVFFQEKQIGWVSKDYYRKDLLFQSLMTNKYVEVTCISNDRKQDYRRASRPDTNGNWSDQYLGMAQFVQAKFEVESE